MKNSSSSQKFKSILTRLFEHQSLTRTEAKEILINMAVGEYNEIQIASFITTYFMRSISVEEILGFRDALLEIRVNMEELKEYNPIDIVGTGGDGKNTFNISTAACFVTAGAGYKVVKHGNYGCSTSISGSSNVMEEHGIKFSTNLAQHKHSIEKTNIAYLHAPLFSPAFKIVAPIRKALQVRTFFNILGPIVNPSIPKRQVLGVYDLKMARLYNYIFQKNKADFSIIHSLDGYDEISLTDSFKIINKTSEHIYTPEHFNFKRVDPFELQGGRTLSESAKIFDKILNNTATEAQKNVVLINAAIAIQTIDPQLDFQACIEKAKNSIESKSAQKTFIQFVNINH